MNLIKLLDIANPKKVKSTINELIQDYTTFKTTVDSVANTANTNASSALTNSQNAVSTANIANTNASTALSNSQEAVSTANTASSTANTALTNSQTAITTANSASTTANTALTNSQTAISTANTASTAAQSAVADAEDALANSLEALGIAQTSSTESSEAKQLAEEAVTTAEAAEALATETVAIAESAAADADDAVDTAELALNTANAARSAVDQALDLGQLGSFVHNTSGIALARAYMTDNVAQTDDAILDRYYIATPKLVRDALASYYTKTETDTLLNAKADTNNVYTKTETDTALSGKANTNDIPTVNNGVLTLKLNGNQIQTFGANEANDKIADIQALPNYSLSIGSTNGGNPRQVLFCSVNYTNFNSESGAYFKLGAMSGHGNGASYTFVEDIFINVNYLGTVTCDVYKYTQQSVTLDSVTRNYGDIFWTIDTTNKIVNFYILLGQYSSAQFTPATKIGAAKAVTSANGITQYTGAPTYYSTGTKNWATGNSTLYARQTDLPTNYVTTNTDQTISGKKIFLQPAMMASFKTRIGVPATSLSTGIYTPGIQMDSNSVDGLAGVELAYNYGLVLWCRGALGASSAGGYQRPYVRQGSIGYHKIATAYDLVPVGTILSYAGKTVPNGYLLCDGSTFNTTYYSELYEVLGSATLPDLRERFLEGANTTTAVGTTKNPGIPNINGSFLIRYGTNSIGPVALSNTPGPFTYQEHYPNTTWGNTLQRSTDDASPSEIGFNAAAGEVHGNTWRNDVYGKSDTVQPKSYCVMYIIKARMLND